PSRATEKSRPNFRPSAMDFCGSRLAIGAATERARALAMGDETKRRMAFVQGLQQSGWTDGRNLRIDIRWGAGDAERIRRYAAELAALAPDVILAVGGAVVPSLLQATRTVPIVFTQTPDPVGAGFVPGTHAMGPTRRTLLWDLPPIRERDSLGPRFHSGCSSLRSRLGAEVKRGPRLATPLLNPERS